MAKSKAVIKDDPFTELQSSLTNFNTVKKLRQLHNEKSSYEYNVVAELTDGEHAMLRIDLRPRSTAERIKEAQRITFFIDGEEYEFAACSRD